MTQLSPAWRVAALAVVAAICCIGFMTLNVRSDWDFTLAHRAPRLAGMLLVACAIGLSTVLFQTITHSRLLTPALMGFDVLYVLVHTMTALLIGKQLGLQLGFAVEVGAMVILAVGLFRLLFSGNVRSLHLLILLGILAGVLFRELAELATRVLDPSEFAIQAGRNSASFGRINLGLLSISAVIVLASAMALFSLRRKLDVLGLGQGIAINLGLNYKRLVFSLLALIALLVSVATALVGPTLFFGLLIANASYWLLGSQQHRFTLPASALIGIICLVGGQVLLEHLLRATLPLAMVIELIGGLLFIALLMRGVKQ